MNIQAGICYAYWPLCVPLRHNTFTQSFFSPDDSVYQKACTTTNKLGCEVGDTSAKFGTMDLAQSDKVNRYFYTDTNVALSGAYTILGRSVTIHEQNRLPGRYACADITEQVLIGVTMNSDMYNRCHFSMCHSLNILHRPMDKCSLNAEKI